MKSESITILGIESSCDETAAAVCIDEKIISNVIANQSVHEQYGGVVPELASRAHIKNIVPVVDTALKAIRQDATPKDNLKRINAIAFTQAPGLIGSLLVGSQFAKSLAISLNVPLISVHHMQAHVLANLIEDPKPSFPFLCLTVSGGHTQIVLCESVSKMRVLGETIDDAAGEAFDKSAKLLGLPYPGGPLIDKFAQSGTPDRFQFPEPQIAGLNFSFSGLKTSILYFLQEQKSRNPNFIEENLEDICASIQQRITTILLNKVKIASLQTGIKEICLAGGVSANSTLRRSFEEMGKKYRWNTFVPAFQFCTDNAAMIALAGYYKFRDEEFANLSTSPTARAEW